MGQPLDAYREGYEKGQKQTAGDALAQVTMGMLRDDPGGYFAAGYHDGASGKPFSLPRVGERKPAAELNPFDDKVAIKTVCPNCGALDWFEWKFLGRLKDPICGHTWYAGSGTYVLMQIRAAFGAGSRFTKYLSSGISGEGAWIARAMGWFIGTILGIAFRLEFGLLMIPIQAVVGLCRPRKTSAEIVSRIAAIAVFAAALGLLYYELKENVILGAGHPLANVQFPGNTLTEGKILGRWILRPSGPGSGEGSLPVYYVFLPGNKVLMKFYGDGDPGAVFPWRILDGSHLQIDLRGALKRPISIIYQTSVVDTELKMNCVAKDYHGQGSGGCLQEREVWSLVSRDQHLTKDELAVVKKLTRTKFSSPPRY